MQLAPEGVPSQMKRESLIASRYSDKHLKRAERNEKPQQKYKHDKKCGCCCNLLASFGRCNEDMEQKGALHTRDEMTRLLARCLVSLLGVCWVGSR